MKKASFKTRNVSTFMGEFSTLGTDVEILLPSNFEHFFTVKVEEMFQTMKLPIPPTKSTIHSMIFLTEGEATMSIGSRVYSIGKHECMVVPAGQVLSFKDPDVNKGYICGFHPDYIVSKYANSGLNQTFDFLNVWGNHVIRFSEENALFVERILERLFTTYIHSGGHNTAIIQAYLIALLSELKEAYLPDTIEEVGVSLILVRRFKELLFEKIRSYHLVVNYAEELNVSPNHLNKVVKRVTEKSPSAWIEEVLLLEAKVLLFHSEMNIQEIAADLGILDASYFSRLFKKHENMTPLAFRKMIEKS